MCKDKPVEALERYIPKEEELKKVCRIPRALAYKYKRYCKDTEELESIGNYGLAYALSTYKLGLGRTLQSYCFWVVKNRLLEFLNSAKKRNSLRTISLSNKLIKNVRESPSLSDTLISKVESPYLITERKDIVNKLLNSLLAFDKQIVVMYSEGKTFKDIGDELGYHVTTIRLKYDNIISKLKMRAKRLEKNSNRNIQDNLTKWRNSKNYKFNIKHSLKGRNKSIKIKRRSRERLGWVDYPMGVCKILNILADGIARTKEQLKLELGYSEGSICLALQQSRDANYIKVSCKEGKKAKYTITEKALSKRRKSNESRSE